MKRIFKKYTSQKSYFEEKDVFTKNVKPVFRTDPPTNANEINSHVL